MTKVLFIGVTTAFVLELPADVRPVVQFLHATGWRLNEALTLAWDQIDWEGQVIRVSGNQTKGGDDRVFPFGMAPDLKALLEARLAARDGVFVFHRNGKRIVTFIKTWRSACKRAGLVDRLVHDLRRTAARNFRRAGVDEGTIMKLCGWKTRSMFGRYTVIDEIDLAEAVAKRARFNGTPAAQSEPSAASNIL
jgi:integrase